MSDWSQFLTGLRKYVLVGIIATGVDWALFSLLVFVLNWNYLLAGIVSFVVATFAGYLSGLRLVFRGGRYPRWVEIAFSYIASLLGFAMHLAVLFVLASWLDVHVFVAKAVATGVTFLWNYAARFFWIFERERSNA